MKYFCGLDVSLNSTAICVVNQDGDIVREGEVPRSLLPSTIGSATSVSSWRGWAWKPAVCHHGYARAAKFWLSGHLY